MINEFYTHFLTLIIIFQINNRTEEFSFLGYKLYHQKLYVNEECYCKHELQILIECALQILLPYEWHFSLDIETLSFSLLLQQLFLCILCRFLLPVHLYLFLMFGAGSRTSSIIPRNIFIFNWIINVKPCNFRLRTWGNA